MYYVDILVSNQWLLCSNGMHVCLKLAELDHQCLHVCVYESVPDNVEIGPVSSELFQATQEAHCPENHVACSFYERHMPKE